MLSTNAYALLGLLAIQPMNGYMMKQRVDQLLSHFWKTSYGQIYPTMKKFIQLGLVTVEERAGDNAPASKYYYITEQGRTLLMEWLSEETLDFNSRDESLLKFNFSMLLPVDTVIQQMEQSLDVQQMLYDGYQSDKEQMQKVTDPTRQQMIHYLSVQKGIYLNQARIAWLKDCIDKLKWFDEKEKKKETSDHE